MKGGVGVLDLDWASKEGEVKDINFIKSNEGIILKNFLEGYTGFKKSLYHEYEDALRDFLVSVRTMRDHGEDGLEAQRLIADIYSKGKKNETR